MLIQKCLRSNFTFINFVLIAVFISFASLFNPTHSWCGENKRLAQESWGGLENYTETLKQYQDLVLKKYCPDEFNVLSSRVGEYRHFNPSAPEDEIAILQSDLLEFVFPFCEQKEKVSELINDFFRTTRDMDPEKFREFKDTIDLQYSEQILGIIASTKRNPVPEGRITLKEKCEFPGCKKRLLMPECKCGLQFCGRHYQREKHSCKFDVKEEFRKKLTKKMPEIKDEKMPDRI